MELPYAKLFECQTVLLNVLVTLLLDFPLFSSPIVITVHNFRPNLLLETANDILYILELATGFETNMKCNVERKEAKYSTLSKNLRPGSHCSAYKLIRFFRYLPTIHTAPFLCKNPGKTVRFGGFTLLIATKEQNLPSWS